MVHGIFEMLSGGEFGDILFLIALIFVLGFFLEWIEISYIALPMFFPMLVNDGADMIWLGPVFPQRCGPERYYNEGHLCGGIAFCGITTGCACNTLPVLTHRHLAARSH